MSDNVWKPKYYERYYTIDYDKLNEYKQSEKSYTADDVINCFIWLDIDDDERLYKEGNVYPDRASAQTAAKAA